MAMLAEAKKKNSKFGSNPQGMLWSKDENKFGQKLLEKMGWSKGKGLGKDGQGCKEPLRQSKLDGKGLGYAAKENESQSHCEKFEDVLANLSNLNTPQGSGENSPNEEQLSSLEARSKSMKKRVHYKKFTQGKDLSQFNEDDIACIIGSKKARRHRVDPQPTNEDVNAADHSINTVHGGSLKDYFNHKMEQLKRKREEGLLGDGEATGSDSSPTNSQLLAQSIPDLEFEPTKTEFSFNYTMPIDTPVKTNLEGGEQSKEKKKKKKSKNKSKEELDVSEVCVEEVKMDGNELVTERKKKKRRKCSENEDVNDENVPKKKKSKKCDESEDVNGISDENVPKKKKSKKCDESEDVNGINDENVPKKKKNKKCDESEDVNGISDENVPKKKKSKKCDESEDVNEIGEENISKKKKKKKSKEYEEIDEVCDKSLNTDKNEITIEKKRKKKNKSDENKQPETVNISISEENVQITKESDRSLRKLKRISSVKSLTHLILGDKTDRPAEVEQDSNSTLQSQTETKPRKKLTSKRSFKELKHELEDKVKNTFKKKEKFSLETIDEGAGELTNDSNRKDEEHLKDIVIVTSRSKDAYNKTIVRKTTCNLAKIFPGSNLASIKGYDEI